MNLILNADLDIEITYREPVEWTNLASIFSHSFSLNAYSIDLPEIQKLKLAFLLGCRAIREMNLGIDIRPKMDRKAVAIGLDNPAELLISELDSTKALIMSSQKSY